MTTLKDFADMASRPIRPGWADAAVGARPSEVELRRIAVARMVWTRELDTLSTRLEEQDTESCLLCGVLIPEGPAWLITDRDNRAVGYTAACCYDLAARFGVTRWECDNIRPGTALVPAGAARELVERENAAIARRRSL